MPGTTRATFVQQLKPNDRVIVCCGVHLQARLSVARLKEREARLEAEARRQRARRDALRRMLSQLRAGAS